MTSWQVLVRSALICSLVSAVLFGLSLKKINDLPISNTPLKFDPVQAHATMNTLSKQFPNRVTWSEERRKAGAWIKDEFRKAGYEPKGMFFSEVIDGKRYTDLENIYAERRGTTHPDEIIVVAAHYDITDTTVEGAMDDASGVGVVLELARVFARENPSRTVLFLTTDSEEFGALWGARAFARDFDRADKIVAVANFDFVAPEKQVAILTLCDGLKQGYTPLWLRELALDSLRSVGGAEVLDLAHIVEHVQRAIQIPAADHGAFLAAGIPAFNWVGQMANFPYQMAHYHHTPHDRADAFTPDSFNTYGKAAERLVRSIDSLSRIPENPRDSSYWKVTERYYVDGWVVTLLHILAFIPFLAYSLSKFGITLRRNPPELSGLVIRNEAKNMGIILGSLLLGYVVMLLLPALRIITQYEVFPATQKSRILYSPNLLALALVAAAIAGVYFVFKRTFAEPEDINLQPRYLEIRHGLHAALLALIIFLAFLKNSYLATLLLLPPAYFWTALRAKHKQRNRVLNALLLLGGAVTFIITIIVLSTIFHVGVAYWYLFLSAAYGLISAYSVVLFFMALTVMIRLFRTFIL